MLPKFGSSPTCLIITEKSLQIDIAIMKNLIDTILLRLQTNLTLYLHTFTLINIFATPFTPFDLMRTCAAILGSLLLLFFRFIQKVLMMLIDVGFNCQSEGLTLSSRRQPQYFSGSKLNMLYSCHPWTFRYFSKLGFFLFFLVLFNLKDSLSLRLASIRRSTDRLLSRGGRVKMEEAFPHLQMIMLLDVDGLIGHLRIKLFYNLRNSRYP